MAPPKANATSPSAKGVEKKKREKKMPKALENRINEMEARKRLDGFSSEEILFDNHSVPQSLGYSYLGKGNPGLMRSCRKRTADSHQTYFTVFDSSTYLEKGSYFPPSVKLDAERATAAAAESRKRKSEKEAEKQAAAKKQASKKNIGKNGKTVAKPAVRKGVKQEQHAPKVVKKTKSVGQSGSNGYKATEETDRDHASEESSEKVHVDPVHEDRSDEQVPAEGVGGKNMNGDSNDIAGDQAGQTQSISNEHPDGKMEMDQGDRAADGYPDGFLAAEVGDGASGSEYSQGVSSGMADAADTLCNGAFGHEGDIRGRVSETNETADEEGSPGGGRSMEDIRGGQDN